MFETLKKNYLSSFDDKINKIENALESSDIQVLSTLVHQLTGSSGSYGYADIADQCSKIEHLLGTSSDFERLNEAVKKLTQLMQQAQNKTS